MKNNLMQMYIKNTENFIRSFTKAFFAEKYNEEISNYYIETYINARIYNEGNENQRYFYKRVSSSLEDKTKEIRQDYKYLEAKFFKNIENMYDFIYYVDGLRKINDLKEFSKEICNIRKSKFEYMPITGLDERLYRMMRDFIANKEKLISEVETEDFILNVQKYILVDNTYRAELKYNFKIPYIYSQKVINEVYNEGTINEDKLIIEYIMVVAECIKDIDKGDFDKVYVVDFASTLFPKKNKLKQTLRIIENEAIQAKIILKVNYKDFINNREQMYNLIKDGFRFAIIIDDDFEFDLMELKKLDIFDYLIVPTESINYENIKENENIMSSEIIYE